MGRKPHYKRTLFELAIGVVERRILEVLDARASGTVQELAGATGVDYGVLSNAVTRLCNKRLLTRELIPCDWSVHRAATVYEYGLTLAGDYALDLVRELDKR